MKLVDKDALLAAIDKERKIPIEQERLGAEHIVVHHARRLVEDAPTIDAIPVEWLEHEIEKAKRRKYGQFTVSNITKVLYLWEKEQEAR